MSSKTTMIIGIVFVALICFCSFLILIGGGTGYFLTSDNDNDSDDDDDDDDDDDNTNANTTITNTTTTTTTTDTPYIGVNYGDKIHIAKFFSGAHRLMLLNGEAKEVYHNIDDNTQFSIQSADNSLGCVQYGDRIRIGKLNESGAYRLSLKSLKAKEVKHNIDEHTVLAIQSIDNKSSGCVKYGDKIHIGKIKDGGIYRLRLLDGKADEVKHNIGEDTQLVIQKVG
jgi:hypothetical protein